MLISVNIVNLLFILTYYVKKQYGLCRSYRRIKTGEEHPFAVVIFDAALLIESGAYEMVDIVILVYVNEELQINRLMNRDGLTREDAVERINAQMPVAEKKNYADYIIDTSSSQKDDIEKQVRYVFELLKTLSVRDKGSVH